MIGFHAMKSSRPEPSIDFQFLKSITEFKPLYSETSYLVCYPILKNFIV